MPQPTRPTDARQALLRLLDHPELPALLPALPAPAVARLYDAVGLHDAGPLMALTPLPLLVQALDVSLWPADGSRPEPEVLVDWIAVWLEEGDEFTAEALAALDEELLALCLDPLIRVEDSHVTTFSRLSEDRELDPDHYDDVLDDGPCVTEFDRFRLLPLQDDAWEVLERVLVVLWTHQPDRLLRLLERLARTEYHSESDLEAKRLRALDVAAAREAVRERAGFVAHDAGQGFLGLARALPLEQLLAMDDYDPETKRHLGARGGGAGAAGGGYRSLAGGGIAAGGRSYRDDLAGDEACGADVWGLLAATGILNEAPASLRLTGPRAPDPLRLTAELQRLADDAPDAFERCAAELAYLANALLASAVAETDARELAFATANLGLELIGAHGLSAGLERPPGLVRAFLVGWRAQTELPARVVEACAAALTAPAVRGRLAARPWLDAQMQASRADLEAEVAAGQFDAARESLALLSLALNVEACRALASVLDRPPRFPAALEPAAGHAARWIRSRNDLVAIGAVLARLPQRDAALSRARRRAPSSARSRPSATSSPSARGRTRESPE